MLQYLKKEVSDEVDFLPADQHESFLQINTMISDGDDQALPKFPNSKFAISLQYLKKEVRDEVDFFHADKRLKFPEHQGFLQGDTVIIDGHGQAFSKYSK